MDQVKGPDMASVGRVLLEHFRTHGTPVMIGILTKILCNSFNMIAFRWRSVSTHYSGSGLQ